MPPLVVCLDLEGVLIPEVWIAFAEKTGIDALRRTTRDEPDYDKLMRGRLEILDEQLAVCSIRAHAGICLGLIRHFTPQEGCLVVTAILVDGS